MPPDLPHLFPALRGIVRPGAALQDLLAILIVEDEQEVQTIVEDALTEGGFEPAVTPSGEEAVTLLKGNKGNTHLWAT